MKRTQTVPSNMEAYLTGGDSKYTFSQSRFRRSLADARKREDESLATFAQQEYRQTVLREMRHARGEYSPQTKPKFTMVVEEVDCDEKDTSSIDYVEFPSSSEVDDISFSSSSEESSPVIPKRQ